MKLLYIDRVICSTAICTLGAQFEPPRLKVQTLGTHVNPGLKCQTPSAQISTRWVLISTLIIVKNKFILSPAHLREV